MCRKACPLEDGVHCGFSRPASSSHNCVVLLCTLLGSSLECNIHKPYMKPDGQYFILSIHHMVHAPSHCKSCVSLVVLPQLAPLANASSLECPKLCASLKDDLLLVGVLCISPPRPDGPLPSC
eukprot:5318152-Amphidinium_carterae.1